MKTNFTVTQNGEILDTSKYTWDEDTKTFSTTENNLVLDFSDVDNCTFNTGYNCTFKTGSDCTFKTGSSCTFDTCSDCTFKTSSDCTFNTGSYCVVIRRDVYEVIELESGKKIKLNGYNEKGFTYITDKKVITIDGKDIEISSESFEELKKQLI